MDWNNIVSAGLFGGLGAGLSVLGIAGMFRWKPELRADPWKRRITQILGMLPLVMVLGTRAWMVGSPDYILAQELAQVVAGTSSQYPQRINADQEVTKVTAQGTTITFVNRFINLSVADIDVNALFEYRDTLRRAVCESDSFVRKGATQTYAYYDRSDVFVTQLTFTLADCRET